jgi:hypothetical protein
MKTILKIDEIKNKICSYIMNAILNYLFNIFDDINQETNFNISYQNMKKI